MIKKNPQPTESGEESSHTVGKLRVVQDGKIILLFRDVVLHGLKRKG